MGDFKNIIDSGEFKALPEPCHLEVFNPLNAVENRNGFG
jgi:hypothetical protein